MIRHSPVRRAPVRSLLRVRPGMTCLPSCAWHATIMEVSGIRVDDMTSGEVAKTVAETFRTAREMTETAKEMTEIAGEMTKAEDGRGAAGARVIEVKKTAGVGVREEYGPGLGPGLRIVQPGRRRGLIQSGGLIAGICPRRRRTTRTRC